MPVPLALRQFYSLAAKAPPLGLDVRVLWGGRGPFEAARVIHPRTRAVCWMTYEADRATGQKWPVFLPCRRRPRDLTRPWAGWHTLKGDNPEFWAPLDPARWRLFDLPAVALTLPEASEPRLWSSRQSFHAADAAEVAAEMEADRERAGREQGDGAGRGQRRELWWLDATQITYSDPGRITKREAEGRIMRALASDTFDEATRGLGLGRRNALRQLDIDEIRALAEFEADAVPEERPRFVAGPPDALDYLTAMTWFAALGARELSPALAAGAGGWPRRRPATPGQLVLFYASRDDGLSFGDIARALRIVTGRKISRGRAHQLYRAAIEAVWAIANGFHDEGPIRRDAALAAIKDANRRARGSYDAAA